MMGARKPTLALAVLALSTVGLSACGGGDSEASISSSSVPARQESTAPAPAADQASGSAGFRTPGGDNSIQDFGAEADAPELDAATVALGGYLRARARDDWARECSYLAKTAVAPLEQLASRSPQLEGKDCAGILETLTGRAPASTRANPLTGDIASLRFEGDRGFALFHGSGGIDYFVPMVKEGGKWKVGAIAPSEFPG